MLHTSDSGPEYSPDEWAKLQMEIEKKGGAILPEVCTGEPLKFDGKHKTNTETCFCSNQSMVVLMYDPFVEEGKLETASQRGAGFARVCLVCDAVGQWPKFRHVLDEIVEEESD
jgi:hypothetical protein